MKVVYPATIEKMETEYYIEFPDLKGCQSWGDTIEEAIENAQEALEGYLLSLYENGECVNKASDINDIITTAGVSKSYIYCDIEIKSETLVKKTLTIPDWVNDLGIKKNINFSKALTEAIISKL